jgi:hypothetical protein
MTMLDSTLELVERTGWRIFPSVLTQQQDGRIDKHPGIRDWPNACSRDPKVIAEWWARWPDASPSLVTGPRNGIVVLDIDVGTNPRTGQPYSGFDSLEVHFKWTDTPITPCVHTRRGGAHFYFQCAKLPDPDRLDDRHPAHPRAIKNSVGLLAPHIDVRGWNGFVVLPAEGTGYHVDPALDFSLPMLTAPGWFNYRPRPKPSPGAKPRADPRDHFDPQTILAEACRNIASAPEGTRHDTFRHETYRIARLVGAGLIDRSRAYSELAAEVMILGQRADGHTHRVQKYFEMAWRDGLAAGRR